MKTFLNSISTAALAATLALGFAAVPVSLGLDGGTLSVGTTKAFARRGADDPAGHVRQGRGQDDAPGHVRGGHGADDPADHDKNDDKGGKTKNDDPAGHDKNDDKGGKDGGKSGKSKGGKSGKSGKSGGEGASGNGRGRHGGGGESR